MTNNLDTECEFIIGGRALGKSYSLRESIKKQFECGCMTDELLDSLMSKGSSVGDFECKHGLSIQFARGGMISHDG